MAAMRPAYSPPLAVEQRHLFPDAQPQHMHRVVRGVLGQLRRAAGAERGVGVEARGVLRHIVAPSTQGANSSSP